MFEGLSITQMGLISFPENVIAPEEEPIALAANSIYRYTALESCPSLDIKLYGDVSAEYDDMFVACLSLSSCGKVTITGGVGDSGEVGPSISIREMFSGCPLLTSAQGMDTKGHIENLYMYGMYSNSGLVSCGAMDLSACYSVDAQRAYQGCADLVNAPIFTFANTVGKVHVYAMLSNCGSLDHIGGWTIPSVYELPLGSSAQITYEHTNRTLCSRLTCGEYCGFNTSDSNRCYYDCRNWRPNGIYPPFWNVDLFSAGFSFGSDGGWWFGCSNTPDNPIFDTYDTWLDYWSC